MTVTISYLTIFIWRHPIRTENEFSNVATTLLLTINFTQVLFIVDQGGFHHQKIASTFDLEVKSKALKVFIGEVNRDSTHQTKLKHDLSKANICPKVSLSAKQRRSQFQFLGL